MRTLREPEPEPEWIQNTKKGNKKKLGWKIWKNVSHPIKFYGKCFAPHKKNAKMFRTPADCNPTGMAELKVTAP